MNLDKIFSWIIGVVICYAFFGDLGYLQNWISKAQAKLIYDSRASSWGSPKFFPCRNLEMNINQVKKKGSDLPQF